MQALAAEAKERQREAGGDKKSSDYKKSLGELIPQAVDPEQAKTSSKVAQLYNTNKEYIKTAKKLKAT
jgi:hypothetical protein